jgi:hypothetical protein
MRALHLQTGQPLYVMYAFNSSLVMVKSSSHDSGSGFSQCGFPNDPEVEGAPVVDGVGEDFLTTELAVHDDESSMEEPAARLGGSLPERDELVAEARRGRLSCAG